MVKTKRRQGQRGHANETAKAIISILLDTYSGADEGIIRDKLRERLNIRESKGIKKHLAQLKSRGIIVKNYIYGDNSTYMYLWALESTYFAFKNIAKEFLFDDQSSIKFLNSEYLKNCPFMEKIPTLILLKVEGKEKFLIKDNGKLNVIITKLRDNFNFTDQEIEDFLLGNDIDNIFRSNKEFLTGPQKIVVSKILQLSPTSLRTILFNDDLFGFIRGKYSKYSIIPLFNDKRWLKEKQSDDAQKAFISLYTFLFATLISDIIRCPSIIDDKRKGDFVKMLFNVKDPDWEFTPYFPTNLGKNKT